MTELQLLQKELRVNASIIDPGPGRLDGMHRLAQLLVRTADVLKALEAERVEAKRVEAQNPKNDNVDWDRGVSLGDIEDR